MRGVAALSVALFAAFASAGSAATADDALALYGQKRYVEAKAAFEQRVKSNPSDAAACYYLAMTLQKVPSPSLDAARSWLEKAVQIAPDNEVYLAEYAGVTMLIADRDHSFVEALEGRNAMAKAIAIKPGDLEACEGLMQFYAKAPWPLGDSDKAMELAGEIAKRDAKRGSAAFTRIAGIFEKEGRSTSALAARQSAQMLAPQPAR